MSFTRKKFLIQSLASSDRMQCYVISDEDEELLDDFREIFTTENIFQSETKGNDRCVLIFDWLIMRHQICVNYYQPHK